MNDFHAIVLISHFVRSSSVSFPFCLMSSICKLLILKAKNQTNWLNLFPRDNIFIGSSRQYEGLDFDGLKNPQYSYL